MTYDANKQKKKEKHDCYVLYTKIYYTSYSFTFIKTLIDRRQCMRGENEVDVDKFIFIKTNYPM